MTRKPFETAEYIERLRTENKMLFEALKAVVDAFGDAERIAAEQKAVAAIAKARSHLS